MKLFGKYYIDIKSMFKKGVKKIEEPFAVFLVCGRMGSGKTYFCTKYASEHCSQYKIKTNIHSLNIPKANIQYFTELSEIYNDTEEYTMYIIDELGKKFTKDSKPDKDFYNFLQHSRKSKRIVFMIHQEYYQKPYWLRGPVSEVFTTEKIPILPLFCTSKGIPYLEEDTKEWNIEPTELYIYKRNKSISSYYNTFESVAVL